MQKVILARELSHPVKVVVASSPTRGLDIGATYYVYQRFLELLKTGAGILLISEDLDEIFNLSDRIAVIYNGRIMGTFNTGEVDEEKVGLADGWHRGRQIMAKRYSYRIEKRKDIGILLNVLSIVVALVVSLIIASGIIIFAGETPKNVFMAIAKGAFGSQRAIIDTLDQIARRSCSPAWRPSFHFAPRSGTSARRASSMPARWG